jgi:hypothetical protein
VGGLRGWFRIVVGIGGWTRASSVLELIYVAGGIALCIAAL